ncbi:MAG TPA: MFS transporter [Xanthobacteraceae bacterium]|nr:MFS transporter [Xanthobacteraceae bacterium]
MLIVGTAGFFDAFDAISIAFVLPVLIGLWHISPGEIGALISIGYVGQLLGAVGFSRLAESYGRQRVLCWTIVVIGLLSIACALAWNYQSLFWFRFVQGLGLGAEVPIAATYMNELTRHDMRGRMVALFQSIFAFGVMATALVSIWVVPHLGWNRMFIIGAIPAILAIWLRRLVPESPRWLASHGRLDEADTTLQRIEDKASAGGVALPPLPMNIPKIVKQQAGWLELFGSAYLGRTLTAWAMAFTTSIVGYGLLAWLPTIYRTVYHLPLDQNLRYSFISYFVGLFGSLFGALLIDRFGRRPSYITAFVGAALPLLSVWWISRDGQVPIEAMVALASVSLFFISILLAGIYVYMPEIYPTRMRALGSGTASAWLRIASIVGPAIVGFILGSAGLGSVFLFFAVAGLAGALIVFLFAIETKGKVLEEISR